MSPHDEASIIANDATLKDMEVMACEILEFVPQNELPGALGKPFCQTIPNSRIAISSFRSCVASPSLFHNLLFWKQSLLV